MGKVQRFGSVSRLKADRAEYYQQLHAAPWKQINDMIKMCIRDSAHTPTPASRPD